MGDHGPADNDTAEAKVDGRRGGIFISHGTGFVLLLLSVCLSVLVGLIVHFASPRQLVCTCNTPAQIVPTLRTEELRDRCVQLINGGDLHVCNACPVDTTSTKTKPASTTMKIFTVATNITTTTTTTTTTKTTTATTTQTPKISYRLPTAVRPHHYVLELQPDIYGGDPTSFTFNGSVVITIYATEVTSNITLHKKGLLIDATTLSLRAMNNISSVTPSIVNTTYDEVRMFYVIHLDSDLHPDTPYGISMSFSANMTGDAHGGFFHSSYKTDNNESVYLASTQFQSNFARMAFPCFDEPALKATFDITVVRKTTTGRNYISLSNTDIIGYENRGEYVADIYDTTPLMSTYLIAFAVCDFEYLENITANITYRTYVRSNAIQYIHKAHQYGLDLLEWFERNFDPNYPVNKLDNIVVPGFVFSAMENWGLVVYRRDLLNVPGLSVASNDSWAVTFTAHEISHQWFGNLVSPKWWWWLWLNEAFATFFQFHAVQAIYPLRRTTEQFVVTNMHKALVADSSQSSHPLTNDVESTDEIEGSFDTITYFKGGSIVRMLHFVMGEDLFFEGLNLYLITHQYGSVEHEDLLKSLTEASVNEGTPMNISDIFNPWVTQMSFPLVTVRIVEPGVLNVRQERFLSDVNASVTNKNAIYGYRWTIPITYATSANMTNFNKVYRYNEIAWLQHTETEVNISDSVFTDPTVSNSWVLVNLHQTGYYRVNYDDVNWMALVKQLEMNHGTIPPVNRAQIINDAWALQRAGYVNMNIALRTLKFLKYETDFAPWKAFYREIGYLDAMLKRSDLYGAFREFMKVTTTKIYNDYQLNIDHGFMADAVPIDISKVAESSFYACKYGVEQCLSNASHLFQGWMMDAANNRVDPNLLRVSTCTAVRYGGMAEWNFAHDQYKQSEEPFIRYSILKGMASTAQPWLIQRMLNMALIGTKIRKSDVTPLIQYISEETAATEMIWAFVKNNYALLSTYLDSKAISSIIKDVTYSFNTDYFLQELENFAAMVAKIEKYTDPVRKATQSTRRNINWISDHHDVIRDWLTEEGFGYLLPLK